MSYKTKIISANHSKYTQIIRNIYNYKIKCINFTKRKGETNNKQQAINKYYKNNIY